MNYNNTTGLWFIKNISPAWHQLTFKDAKTYIPRSHHRGGSKIFIWGGGRKRLCPITSAEPNPLVAVKGDLYGIYRVYVTADSKIAT